MGRRVGGPKGGPRRVAPKGGAPNYWALKGGGSKGGGPEGSGAQNFALFSLPPHFYFFLLSLGVFSWNFGGV